MDALTPDADDLRIGSLCAGYGGMDLVVESVLPRARLAWYAQYEPPDKDGREDKHQHAAQIMAHHFPGVPNHGDITAIDYTQVEPVDIITAGFPCTDISLAGLRAGLMPGTRSGIWSHVARAIGVLRPSLVLLENVRSLTSARAHCDVEHCPRCMGEAKEGRDTFLPLRALGAVLGDLADLGFDAEWQVVRASDVGAPHRRERVFILAWPASDFAHLGHERLGRPGSSDSGFSAADADGLAPGNDRELPTGWDTVQPGLRPDALGRGSSPADTEGDGWHEGGAESARIFRRSDASERGGSTPADTGRDARAQDEPDRSAASRDRGVVADGFDWSTTAYAAAIARWELVMGRPSPRPTDDRGRLATRFVEWMMGLPGGWVTDVPGVPRNAQLRALGNGVVPQQGTAAFRILADRAFGSPAPADAGGAMQHHQPQPADGRRTRMITADTEAAARTAWQQQVNCHTAAEVQSASDRADLEIQRARGVNAHDYTALGAGGRIAWYRAAIRILAESCGDH